MMPLAGYIRIRLGLGSTRTMHTLPRIIERPPEEDRSRGTHADQFMQLAKFPIHRLLAQLRGEHTALA